MAKRLCSCASCNKRVEFDESEMPCEALRGWFIISHLKGVESVEQKNCCSLDCLKRWLDSEFPEVPEVFLTSMEDQTED